MGKLDWYKRNPAKFIGGTVGMTFEQKGAYSIILDLIYDHDGEILDDSQWIAGVLALQPRRWERIRDALIARGKLYRSPAGTLRNGRADEELKRSSNDHETKTVLDKTQTVPRKTKNDLDIPPSDLKLFNDLTPETRARESQNKSQSQKHIDSAFEEFWKHYPRKTGKLGVLPKYTTIIRGGRATIEEVLAGVKRFAEATAGTETRYIKHPSTWLHNGCWADMLGVPVAVISPEAAFEDADREGWIGRFKRWLDSGYWPTKYGHRPRSGQCQGPKDLLDRALAAWAAQGGHPQGGFPADPNGRYQIWKDLRDFRNDPNVDYGDGPVPGSNVVPLRAAEGRG